MPGRTVPHSGTSINLNGEAFACRNHQDILVRRSIVMDLLRSCRASLLINACPFLVPLPIRPARLFFQRGREPQNSLQWGEGGVAREG
ncbi:MAG: hypothetical protein NNA23_05215 [Nitrospira sp.]|nr:hypothetical protein [Nitrospira sp.]MCP9463530.1 hypothetical protein [Nitrospira sp.]